MTWDDKAYIAAGAAEIESRTNTLTKLVQDGYFSGCYWICENSHEFGHNDIGMKRECPVCKTRMIRWVAKRIE